MRESRAHPDALIIGAGIVGAAIAFELSKRGMKTLNVDAQPAPGYGSTGNSCAIVRTHYSSKPGVAMAREATECWMDWPNYLGVEDEAGTARYVRCGTVLLQSSGKSNDRVLDLYRELGVEFEEWHTSRIEERLPVCSTAAFGPPKSVDSPEFWREPDSELAGAIFTPHSGYVSDPQLATHNLQRAAEARGAVFRFGAKVVDIKHKNGRVAGVVLASGERIDAPVVVNVAGPHSFVINRLAGVEEGMNIKTRALRHEVHHVPSPAGFDFEHDGLHVSDSDLGIYFRPDVGNNILVGSEDPVCDPRTWIDDPDRFDRHITEAQWQAQVYRLGRRLPSLGIPTERRGVVDLYDVSDDWIPIYDRSDLDGFYMAVGTSGNQFKNAPVVGALMADLIEACERGHDHDTAPLVVKTPYKRFEVDTGFFSRRRSIHRDSSFSVLG